MTQIIIRNKMSQSRISDLAAKGLIELLSLMPQWIYHSLEQLGGRILHARKGKIARAAIQLALPHISSDKAETIARQSARLSLKYILSLPKLKFTRYKLPELDQIKSAISQDRGVVVIALHTGPPDLGTMALANEGIASRTVIGAGKQSPFVNNIGRKALNLAGVPFIQRGDPTAVLQAVKRKEVVFLYSDLRSKEMPVTFFGQETSAPASGIYTAMLLKAPVLFHYCTWEDQRWQLHFEPVEMRCTGKRKEDVQYNLQQLMHKMEDVIREHPELWIWHYDRFKLKKRL